MASYLITGANRGIGLELVRQLSALPTNQVSKVFAVARKSSESLEKLSGGGRVTTVLITNFADATEVSKAVAVVSKELDGKGLDVLINNAGVIPFTEGGARKIQDLSKEQLMETIETNVATVLVITSGFLPLLTKGKEKKIFNISTTLGSISRCKNYSWSPAHAYKISKAAENMLSQQFAMELADDGFTVALITPGWLKTDAGSQAADLEVDVGVKAVLDIMLKSGPEQNGKFLNIRVEGFEDPNRGPNWYDGKEIPW